MTQYAETYPNLAKCVVLIARSKGVLNQTEPHGKILISRVLGTLYADCESLMFDADQELAVLSEAGLLKAAQGNGVSNNTRYLMTQIFYIL